MFKVVRKKKPKHILMDWMKNQLEKLNFINLDRQPSIELAVESQAKTTFKPRQMLVVELAVELAVEFFALSDLIFGQTCMVLTLEFEILFLEALNSSQIYPVTSKVCFVKGFNT